MLSESRALRTATIWQGILQDNYLKSNPVVINRYLDVGCNTGSITVAFGKKLGLDKNNIYGIDVDIFMIQEIKPESDFVFKVYDGYKIPYGDNFFDIITCSMVLHHVKYPYILLAEFRRVLKSNGILFVKEHNSDSAHMDMLITLEHILYDMLDYDITYEKFFELYYQGLFSEMDLEKLIKAYGFFVQKIIDKSTKYNPTQSFYGIFIKKAIT
jgi:ubiquinone/menaquinone biosynthesis C-methylase UbiE